MQKRVWTLRPVDSFQLHITFKTLLIPISLFCLTEKRTTGGKCWKFVLNQYFFLPFLVLWNTCLCLCEYFWRWISSATRRLSLFIPFTFTKLIIKQFLISYTKTWQIRALQRHKFSIKYEFSLSTVQFFSTKTSYGRRRQQKKTHTHNHSRE